MRTNNEGKQFGTLTCEKLIVFLDLSGEEKRTHGNSEPRKFHQTRAYDSCRIKSLPVQWKSRQINSMMLFSFPALRSLPGDLPYPKKTHGKETLMLQSKVIQIKLGKATE